MSEGCPSIIMSQGVGFQALDSAAKVLIYSGYVEFHRVCNFAKRLTFEIQAENAAGTTVVALFGLRMTVITVEELAEAFFIFVTGFTFGGKLLGVVVDGLVNDCDVLAVVDDVEGGELGVIAGDDVGLALGLALA